MNAKKWFVALIILNTALLAFAVSLYNQGERRRDAIIGSRGKFGPVIETILTATKPGEPADIPDLETRHALRQPPFEHFNSGAGAIMGWIRSNGLDVSSFLWSGGAACVTYDMSIAPVEGKCWEETTEQELRGNPVLAAARHSPRRLLLQ